ncbi:MAG: WYL domain-containing protein [Clostridia bacterium]|nr:WYL domain-containing protein [Clostridia bacterium]
MASATTKKMKVLYVAKILLQETDENHGLTMGDFIDKLSAYGISAERKSIYMDFDELRAIGMDIAMQKKNKQFYYYLVSRDFELAELKLLVDAVQSAKFITEKKSAELIKKLENLVSRHEAKYLHRQVMISGRVKTMNESIYYNVDALQNAILENRQVTFQYYNWNVKKEQELRHGGERYKISPWGLVWDDEYYYLLGYDAKSGIIKSFRVDKMMRIFRTSDKREGEDAFKELDMARYTKSVFGMFGGEMTEVTLEAKNHMAGILVDRFGRDIIMIPKDENSFTCTVRVALSGQFYGWLVALGEDIRIIAPEIAVDGMRKVVTRLEEQYKS